MIVAQEEIDVAKRKGTLAELLGISARGIRCPACGAAAEWTVYYTRPIAGGVRRVRVCRQCGHQIVTIERLSGAGEQGNRRAGEQENRGAGE